MFNPFATSRLAFFFVGRGFSRDKKNMKFFTSYRALHPREVFPSALRIGLYGACLALLILTAIPAASAQNARSAANQKSAAVRSPQHASSASPSSAKSKSAAPPLTHAQLASLLRRKIKYLFVIYQENRSFDSYFGTFPGADGLFSHPPAQTLGFSQPLLDTNGSTISIQPFRIGPEQFAADTDDVDHSHPMLVAKMNIVSGAPRMDRFVLSEEQKRVKPGQPPSLAAKQMGELAMAYEDCDTVPLLWRYAQRFVLFDHIFQEMTGPSTLGNLSIIAAQSGQTQWVLHPDEAYKGDGNRGPGVPVMNDADPFWGSQADSTPNDQKMPVNPRDSRSPSRPPQLNLTFASLPLTFLGAQAGDVTKLDRDPSHDLADIQHDVAYIPKHNPTSIPFAWFQEGYDDESASGEPTTKKNSAVADDDDDPVDANDLHASYITHHNGPQYFGYIANNPKMRDEMHGMHDFFNALASHALPSQGGMFFIKGGSSNIFGLKPSDPDTAVQKKFNGDDDHPAYSDAQISEALVAKAINAIAASPYWSQSAIIITWDDSEGDYDHVPPPIRSFGPDGSPITDGPRVPLLLISPYARIGYVAHAQGSHASVVKFADMLFNRTPLALLPDERRARALGEEKFHQKDLGPEDALAPNITDLTDAFSISRLLGKTPALSRSYIEIPEALVLHLPAETHYGCSALHITPVDRARRLPNPIPPDFNPRPLTNPTGH
jgi:phospholipase C